MGCHLLKAYLVSSLLHFVIANHNSSLELEDYYTTKVLSRTKRYLVFPDGSSFQLVICEQNMGYLQLGVVWFGNTAALAWELPTDPNFFYMFKDKEKYIAGKRKDTKHIVYFDEDGKVLASVPYHRKPLVNPAFAKRSINAKTYDILTKESIKEMRENYKSDNYLADLDKSRIEFHREGRRSLYVKLESFFQSLGINGKECVLRMLCETAQVKEHQGTFYEEMLKAVFTFPRHHKINEIHKEYDTAHSTTNDCEKLYPECSTGYLT